MSICLLSRQERIEGCSGLEECLAGAIRATAPSREYLAVSCQIPFHLYVEDSWPVSEEEPTLSRVLRDVGPAGRNARLSCSSLVKISSPPVGRSRKFCTTPLKVVLPLVATLID